MVRLCSERKLWCVDNLDGASDHCWRWKLATREWKNDEPPTKKEDAVELYYPGFPTRGPSGIILACGLVSRNDFERLETHASFPPSLPRKSREPSRASIGLPVLSTSLASKSEANEQAGRCVLRTSSANPPRGRPWTLIHCWKAIPVRMCTCVREVGSLYVLCTVPLRVSAQLILC